MEIKSRVCPKCGKEKELNLKNWYQDRNRKNGFNNQCKECLSTRMWRPHDESIVGDGNLTSICPKCAIEKPITEEYWYKNSTSKYGLDLSRCKLCLRESSKIHKLAWRKKQSKIKKILVTKADIILFLAKKHRCSMVDITDTLIKLAKQELIATILLKQIKKMGESHESNNRNV